MLFHGSNQGPLLVGGAKKTAKILKTEIVNRVDTPRLDHVIGNFSLLVGDSEASLAPCFENDNMNVIASKTFPCRMTGQYIRIKTFMRNANMNLCEVRVFC